MKKNLMRTMYEAAVAHVKGGKAMWLVFIKNTILSAARGYDAMVNHYYEIVLHKLLQRPSCSNFLFLKIVFELCL